MNWLIWLIAGIIISILELFTPGFFILGIGVSAAATALPAALHAPFWLELIFFALCIVLFFTFIRPFVMKVSNGGKASGTEAMLGKEATVTETIGKGSNGRVHFKGESWNAISQDKETIEKDTTVVICSIEGVTLTVRRK
ncbi:MAG: NfeD family protein [Spirochaetales bacterium]|nr:NfeD family protein [Candidatus Physcosoma equi]